MGALAQWCARRPLATLCMWLLIVAIGAGLVVRHGKDAFTTAVERFDDSASTRAEGLLAERFAGRSRLDLPNEIVVIQSDGHTVDDPPFGAQVEVIGQRLLALGGDVIAWATSFHQTGDASLVSADRRTTILPLAVRDAERQIEAVRAAVRAAPLAPGFRVHVVGHASVGADYKALAEHDLKAELRIGLPVAGIVLLLVFATIVAAVIPVIVAGAAIVVTLGVVAISGVLVPSYFLVTNMIVMMGLAVGIDYSLFVLSRHREERRGGHDVHAALEIASRTAGRAILFSGATVVLALLGLLLIPTNVFRSLATGAILVVVVAVFASLTLLPALITLLGDHLEHLRIPLPVLGRNGGHWDRITRAVTRRPVLSLVATVGLLGAAALPALHMESGFAGIETLPERMDTRQGFRILKEQFRIGVISQAVVVVDGDVDAPAVLSAIEHLRSALAWDPTFFVAQAQLQVNPGRTLAVLEVPMAGDAESAEAQAGIRRLRDEHIPTTFTGVPARALAAGGAAGYIDFFRLTERYTPLVFAFVFALSFVLLAVAFRSLVVPVKAILMNLLSVGAAYGLMVLVFQHGVGAALLGFEPVPHIEAWIPLFLFTILYGLSMDYHVFLLSRIREHFESTGDTALAVAHGLRSTAAVITGAALIMVAIFAGFASGELVMFQQVGFGLAVAVLLDATVVRSVLVPAAMTLLGSRNWYLPRWLAGMPRL